MSHNRNAFHVLGIPIRIDASWWLIFGLISWSLATGYFPSLYPGGQVFIYAGMGILSAALLFTCVLLHELGHSLVARLHGMPVSCVTLFLFGGVAQISSGPKRPFIEFQVAVAGPMVSAVIAWLCFNLSAFISIDTVPNVIIFAIIKYLAVVNTALLIFNLLPGLPLDGGRVFRAIIWAITGRFVLATRIASITGAVCGVLLIALGVWVIFKGGWFGGIWYVVLGWFLRNSAMASYRQVR